MTGKQFWGMTLNSLQLHGVKYGRSVFHSQMTLRGIQSSVCSPNFIYWRCHIRFLRWKKSWFFLELLCFILTIWFFHKFGMTFSSFYWLFFPSSVFTSLLGASRAWSIETPVQVTRYEWLTKKFKISSQLMACLDLNAVHFEVSSYNWSFQRMWMPRNWSLFLIVFPLLSTFSDK